MLLLEREVMSEILDIPLSRNDSSHVNFRILLVSIFIDRLTFYGLRVIIVLSATLRFDIRQEDFLYYYGFYALITSVGSLIGGLISDFLTGPKITMIIGLLLCLLGGGLTLIENGVTFYMALFLLLIGSGFFKAGSLSFIGHISINKPGLLEKRFILNYLAICLGSFLAYLTIGLIRVC